MASKSIDNIIKDLKNIKALLSPNKRADFLKKVTELSKAHSKVRYFDNF